MAKYLLLKHYRGAPAPGNDVPMDQWRPEEVDAHIRFMADFGARLEANGEPLNEWLEVRPFLAMPPALSDGPLRAARSDGCARGAHAAR